MSVKQSCYPKTYSVDQPSLELRNLPASASQVLGLKVCTTTIRLVSGFLLQQDVCVLCATILLYAKHFIVHKEQILMSSHNQHIAFWNIRLQVLQRSIPF